MFWRDVGDAMTEAFEILRFFDCLEHALQDIGPDRVWLNGYPR